MVFNRDSRSSGTRDFGRRRFDDRGGDRQMFKAICSKCGKECEVPFKPTGNKPVYCRDCFRTVRDSDSRKPSFDNNRGSSYPQYKEQFEALNVKLDKVLKLLNPEKPIEAPKVIVVSQVKATTNSEENVKRKKKTKAKKLASTETPTE